MLGVTRWDAGLTWVSRLVTAQTELPIDVDYVRDSVLRVTNGSIEDEFIIRAIRAAVGVFEHETQTALMPQTWAQDLSGFPASGVIEIVRPPFRSLTSVAYYDSAGDVQEVTLGSPAETEVLVSPSGPYARAILRALPGATFPTAAVRGDAVTITFEAGYATKDAIPEPIISGICLMVAELYKQRSLSQVGTSIVPAPLDTSRFWKRVW